MASIILSNANLYAEMAASFYHKYLLTDKERKALPPSIDLETGAKRYIRIVDLLRENRKAATAAVVFQALAIESYINLLGMYAMGEELFYEKPEKDPPAIKLQKISKHIGHSYPQDHLSKIRALFDKRNKLVHEKPKVFSIRIQPFDYDHPEKSYDDINSVFEEDRLVFRDIDEEMKLYNELQQNVMMIRNSKIELIEEIQQKLICENTKDMIEAEDSMFGLYHEKDQFADISVD